MRIIHLKDDFPGLDRGAEVWTWDSPDPDMVIEFFQWLPISPQKSDYDMGMFLGSTQLLARQGCHTPESMWRIITDTLLEHDILCAPLATDDYLTLPKEHNEDVGPV